MGDTSMVHDILKLIDKNTWIASDHHHNHKQIGDFEPSRIIRAAELGYDNYEDMLVAEHNKLVAPDDLVLFLGDFSFASPIAAKKYNGRKILVLGNHDTRGDHACYSAGFEFVARGTYVNFNDNVFHCAHQDPNQSMIIMDIKNHRCALTHYPLGFDDPYNYQREDGNYSILNRINYSMQLASDFDVLKVIHGHLHSKIASSTKFDYINVCLEHTDFKPVRIGDLL
jgi:calcineurin-like phosphoesterase family protein